MVSKKKFNFKKVWITIIIAVLVLSIVSFAATKIIYDSIFVRYDCENLSYPKELIDLTSLREKKSYKSGRNMLSGYLYKSTTENCKDALIIMAPGYKACADSYLWQIQELLQLGWSVFIFDVTGNCSSGGGSEIGFSQELCDLKATLNYVEKQKRFGYNDIVLLGHSRGGYAACCSLAYDYDIAAVVSVSGINSAMEGVIGAATNYVGPIAYCNYGFLWLYQSILFGSETVNLRADKVISSSSVPVLVVHGENDEIVPASKYSIVSHKEKINNKNVDYIIRSSPDNSGHTNLLFDKDGTANNELIKKINDFLIENIVE